MSTSADEGNLMRPASHEGSLMRPANPAKKIGLLVSYSR